MKTSLGVGKFLDPNMHRVYLDRVPVAIFSAPLARLKQRLDNLDGVEVLPNNVAYAAKYLATASKTFRSEEQRRVVIEDTITKQLGPSGGEWDKPLEWAQNIRPDASWWRNDFAVILLVLKNTVGLGGEAVIQALVDFSKIVASNRVCYCLLL